MMIAIIMMCHDLQVYNMEKGKKVSFKIKNKCQSSIEYV